MATVAQNIAIIQTKAAELDTLIAQFLVAKAIIGAAEDEIRKAQPGANHHVIGGRVGLPQIAIAMMERPVAGGSPLAAIAASAWSGVVG